MVDTPGFNSSFDDLESLVWLLADLEEISVFVIVFKQGDRFSSELARSLNSVGKLLGPIWRNTVVVVSHWSYQASASLLSGHGDSGGATVDGGGGRNIG